VPNNAKNADGPGAMIVTGTHDPELVALSVLVAIAASYTALDLFPRARSVFGRARTAWLIGAAIAMGGGIWAMHFIGMLAFVMPMPISFDGGLTIASLLLPIVVAALAFVIVNRQPNRVFALLGSGLVLGLSIVTMHYLGMAAMRMPGSVAYDPALVGLSVAIAIGAATAALWLARRDASAAVRTAAAIVMGIAVSGMHYTAMAAAQFSSDHAAHAEDAGGFGQTELALAIASLTFLILFLAWGAALFDRRISASEVRTAQASEERFRELYRRTPLPMFSVDASGRIEHASDALVRLLGYERADLIGRRIEDLILPEDEATGSIGLDCPGAERRVLSKSGAVLDVCILMEAERDAEGTPVRGLGGVVDLTERRRAEAALLQSQKLEAVGQLTGGVAHDFNNLLMAISGNLDLALRRADDADVRRYLERAHTAVDRGARLTQQLLAFSRRQRLKVEAVSVNMIVEGALELMSSTLGGSVSVKADLEPKLPLAMADATQVDLILLNLAINARDAMPDGGVITIRTQTKIRKKLARTPEGPGPGRYVKLSVEDEGSGMPPDVLARVFEPFFTTKEIGRGSGLGLPQVLGIVKQLGGGIEIETEAGRGSCFGIFLPAATKNAAVDEVAPVEAEHLPHGLRILVVDDDVDVLSATASMIEELGCEVLRATSGAAAVEAIRDGLSVDAVLADYAMPGLSGEQTLKRIQALRPDLPSVLMSGFVEGAGTVTADRLLKKPFSLPDLEAALATALGMTKTAETSGGGALPVA